MYLVNQSAPITFNIARNQETMLTVCDFDKKIKK